MKRYAINELIRWKDSRRRKPLIIEGARQVGKTWLVKEFAAKYYKNLAYINFERQPYLRKLFLQDYDVNRILEAISIAAHADITAGETLIFLDEIQEAENGLTALKYFNEDCPEQHVVAAGSLLGLELHRDSSFPVGKVQFLQLRPMSFLEFLEAIGEERLADLVINKEFEKLAIFSPQLRDLLRKYYYVGGMPEAVLTYSEGGSLSEVREVQEEILRSYDFDFSKHAPAEIVPRIRMLWSSLPAQLSRENRKFIYGLVKSGARAREFEVALQWLVDTGLIYRVMNVSAPRIPLKSYEETGAFKIFCVDVGLLAAMSQLDASAVIEGNRVFSEFKGALTEQYVLQELILHHQPFYYSKANSQLEIDFLIQLDGSVVPIEVKAEENLKAKSLRRFVEENASERAYRISMSDFREESWMLNLPLFAVEAL
ncbi:MAG: ATP-binding protein [Bacteroides sp.]|nr:ATP-binding protein [Bacteroides sp.]